ncbi:rod shape-determining protein MreD [Bacteroidales bacterium OttesenSCG-928-J19]|nr:rod shape-determining protein MreD [Bacteroidales bacterium OttesenSCG-928-J19]
MANNGIRQIVLFFLLVLLQVGLFNKIHLFGYATPILYVYFIIKLPVLLNRNWVILLSFLMGFCVDLFSYTLGLNMLACTLTGFARHYMLKLFTPRDLFESVIPSFSSFGKGLFMRYASALTLLHLIILYLTESFSFFHPIDLSWRIAGSTVLTLILIFTAESLSRSSK